MNVPIHNLRQEPHPLGGTTYSGLGDGRVRVDSDDGSRYGIFTWEGDWLEGDITQADLMMLQYIGGPDMPLDHDILWMMAPPQIYDGSVPVDAPYADMTQVPRIVGKYTADKGILTDEGMRSSAYIDQDFFLNNDRRPDLVPDVFHLKSPMEGGPEKISTDRYTSKEWHDLEVEKLWKKTWQMACREDDIPNVGDYYVYEIANLSYLVVRTEEDEIKAHVNVCLHRGRLLKTGSGMGAKEIRCPFHGWAWNLQGSLKEITTEWDFPGVCKDAANLPSAKVGTWGGFVFINPDENCEPLEEFLGPVMIEHYRKSKLENRYKQAHVQGVVKANWKLVMEAFMEGYHVITTHPQQMLTGGDLSNLRYDVFGNWGRAGHLNPPGISPQRGMTPDPEQILMMYRVLADTNKEFLRGQIGEEVEEYSDAELTDLGTFCDLFPNFHPWAGWTRIAFRFRPNGDNHEESIFDIMLLAPWEEGKPKPPPAKIRMLQDGEAFSAASELMSLAKIIDQDVYNLPNIQKGLKAKKEDYVWFSSYQEGKIRNFHRNYNAKLGVSNLPE